MHVRFILKKMAHLLQHKCYIHCVFSLEKDRNFQFLFAAGFCFVLLCNDHTLLYETRANFINRHWKAQSKMEIALLGIWSF